MLCATGRHQVLFDRAHLRRRRVFPQDAFGLFDSAVRPVQFGAAGGGVLRRVRDGRRPPRRDGVGEHDDLVGDAVILDDAVVVLRREVLHERARCATLLPVGGRAATGRTAHALFECSFPAGWPTIHPAQGPAQRNGFRRGLPVGAAHGFLVDERKAAFLAPHMLDEMVVQFVGEQFCAGLARHSAVAALLDQQVRQTSNKRPAARYAPAVDRMAGEAFGKHGAAPLAERVDQQFSDLFGRRLIGEVVVPAGVHSQILELDPFGGL
ncbi:hypothetical protein [Nocardia sp. N2S4-5]|uniref:hypothetical protein n=1 Tax=Nocardia sp. N2S4-5 TaxID=3351565 RepID=UPI0037CDC666